MGWQTKPCGAKPVGFTTGFSTRSGLLLINEINDNVEEQMFVKGIQRRFFSFGEREGERGLIRFKQNLFVLPARKANTQNPTGCWKNPTGLQPGLC